MKQKYAITVADMELSIISDASPDEVENIVGILDRRMREINLKSPRCTKNEAAILCALSYCSERIAMQEAFKKVEKDAFRFAGENEKLKKNIEQMQEEIDRLRADAAVMRSILDHAAANAAAEKEKKEEARRFAKTETAKETASSMGDQLSAFDNLPDAEEVAEKPVEEKNDARFGDKSKQKNRVGSMFDLLTFSDV